MDVQELAVAAQNLSYEQRKELIQMLVEQQPKSESTEAAGSTAETENGTAGAFQGNQQNNPNLVWLEQHRTEFAGQWVALQGGNLIAHSTDGEALIIPVRQSGARNPFIVFVEPPGTELFVGF
jgi:hypothetical protein